MDPTAPPSGTASSSSPALEIPNFVFGTELAQDVLLFRSAIPWGPRLIETAEHLNLWRGSRQVRSFSTKEFRSDYRTSSSTTISLKLDPAWLPYDKAFEMILHACLRTYIDYNRYVQANVDSGYEMLRYGPGQQFKEHVDIVTGVHGGVRQVSCVTFLNDNFAGGDLVFPRQRLAIRPEPGAVLLFPSGFCYPHAVTPVTAGTRYSVVTWFLADPDKPNTRTH